jgi:hypothetical protein
MYRCAPPTGAATCACSQCLYARVSSVNNVQQHSGAAICASLWLVVSVVTFSSFDAAVLLTLFEIVVLVEWSLLTLLSVLTVTFNSFDAFLHSKNACSQCVRIVMFSDA